MSVLSDMVKHTKNDWDFYHLTDKFNIDSQCSWKLYSKNMKKDASFIVELIEGREFFVLN